MSGQPSGSKRGREPSDDESDEYYDDHGRKVVENSSMPSGGPVKKGEQPSFLPLTVNQYSMDDMNPTVRDPRCKSNTKLACFWPVYVGNFKDNQISLYFASRELHVRWWFRREDEYYSDFQRKAKLFDMLVYFVSERDAKLAVKLCHRDTHKGYTLNVFPGREPVYFDEDRSVHARNMQSGRTFSEQFFEKHVRKVSQVQVKCVVKFDTKTGAVEFERPQEVAQAVKSEKMWKYEPVKGPLQKQRYLEQDVLPQIEKYLAEHPNALNVKQKDINLKKLLSGVRPYLSKQKKFKVFPYRKGPA